MLFNSYFFIFCFLPASLALYYFLNARKLTLAAKASLVLASLVFYGWWKIECVPLILASILFNYAVGTSLTARVRSKWVLALGIAANLAVLGYFKYANFFISNVNHLLPGRISFLNTALPLGISFFTFTQIAYLVDSYGGKAREYDLLNYFLFVTFFPHLLAGPIIHHRDMMPQFDRPRNKVLSYKNLSAGLFLFFIGLFKKVIIADTFAVWAGGGFDAARDLKFFEAWVASLSYTFQLYFDFSGYTDMAIGIAWMFNIRLPENFNSPYKALDIRDFWRRWHITLSNFLRDYVYIPLGGNRGSFNRTQANVFLTFLIGGLWHGAGWTFVFWGALHGFACVAHALWKRAGLSMPKAAAWLVTFNFVNIAWVFFRAKNWGDALKVLRGMAGLNGVVFPHRLEAALGFLKALGLRFGDVGLNLELDPQSCLWAAFLILAGIFFVTRLGNSSGMARRFSPDAKAVLFTVAIMVWSVAALGKVSEFIYFNF